MLLDLGPTLQVLRRPRGGCCRSARSSRPLAGARRREFQKLSSDPSSHVAAAARCEVAKIKESQFLCVPRKREKWLKVFTVFFSQCVLHEYCTYSIYLVWKISPSSGSMSAFFTEVVV